MNWASGATNCIVSPRSVPWHTCMPTTALPGQQEGQQVAQVELVVDGGHQQHQQRRPQHEAGPGGQDVDIALGQRGVASLQRQARLPPALNPHARDRKQGLKPGRLGAARRLMARARRRAWRAPAPRPAPRVAHRAPAGAQWSAAGWPARRRAPRSRARQQGLRLGGAHHRNAGARAQALQKPAARAGGGNQVLHVVQQGAAAWTASTCCCSAAARPASAGGQGSTMSRRSMAASSSRSAARSG
jgi:hypothetical protein